MTRTYDGIVVRDWDRINGGPDVMLRGTCVDDEQTNCVARGTFHGRFLLLEEHLGKRVRVTVEVEP
jgi:hypothetical protein